MKLNLVPPRQGLLWVRLGMKTFWRQPLAMAGLFFMYMASVTVLSLVPMLGIGLSLVLLPAATLGLMAATREAANGKFPMPTVLASVMGVPVDANIASVRAAYTGGSPLPSELAQRFEAATGIPVRNILGMTECAGLVSIEPLRGPRTPGSAGLRLPYTEVHAVPWRDGEAKLDERCAADETGVVVLRGPHMSPGYLDAKRNAGLFEGGWIVTGDLGLRFYAELYVVIRFVAGHWRAD